jgi:hypothetical protein
MKKRNVKILTEDKFFDQFRSPIPPHLTPEERERWEKEVEWERQEYERRKLEGYYPSQD